MSDVTAIISSPNKEGNSATIVNKMVESLKARGKTVDVYHLNDLHLIGCQACMGCKKNPGKCVRKDDLTPVLESVAASGSVILSTPVYFSQPCAQFRMMNDRFYGFVAMGEGGFVSQVPAGKKLAIVATSGGGGGDATIKAIQGPMEGFLKMETVGTIDYKEMAAGMPAKDNEEVLKQAVEIAGKL